MDIDVHKTTIVEEVNTAPHSDLREFFHQTVTQQKDNNDNNEMDIDGLEEESQMEVADDITEVRGTKGLERSKTRYTLKLTYTSSGESAIISCLLAIRDFL